MEYNSLIFHDVKYGSYCYICFNVFNVLVKKNPLPVSPIFMSLPWKYTYFHTYYGKMKNVLKVYRNTCKTSEDDMFFKSAIMYWY